MREMEEERANMREHVMKEVDTDKEIVRNISFIEYQIEVYQSCV